jgi:hypothetical protein
MKNLSIEKIVAATQDAILASGKKFQEIPKEAIEGFLSNSGLPIEQVRRIYKRLEEEYSSRKQKVASESVSSNIPENKSPEYVEKTKSPRKSVFGEIKKIA